MSLHWLSLAKQTRLQLSCVINFYALTRQIFTWSLTFTTDGICCFRAARFKDTSQQLFLISCDRQLATSSFRVHVKIYPAITCHSLFVKDSVLTSYYPQFIQFIYRHTRGTAVRGNQANYLFVKYWWKMSLFIKCGTYNCHCTERIQATTPVFCMSHIHQQSLQSAIFSPPTYNKHHHANFFTSLKLTCDFLYFLWHQPGWQSFVHDVLGPVHFYPIGQEFCWADAARSNYY